MRVFSQALLKALFGDIANTLAVLLGVLVVLVLDSLGDAPAAGWVMAFELVLALLWLSGRYARPKHKASWLAGHQPAQRPKAS